MRNIKLIALDMDGTACRFHQGIETANIMPIIKAQEMGVRVIFATGRPILTSLPEALKVKMDYFQQYFIGFNGACIYDIKANKIVHQQTLSVLQVNFLFQLAKKYHKKIWCYIDDLTKVIVNFDPIGENNLELTFFHGEFIQYDNLSEIKNTAYKCIVMDVQETDPFIILARAENIEIAIDASHTAEMNAPGISKLAGLKWISKQWGITLSEMMAIGDSMNDYWMIKNVGLGIAMNNGQDQIKAIAKDITSNVEEGGVAKMIEKYIFNHKK
ncbi:HAD superfamily hydrolase [Spiroplasma sp. NBRC 100390]|uniref:Cof-type HAD-IIB family hydrolase n=1 Tax=unclassified Spiroplasma TaxID=2637901 RepID=UPI0008929470|nr:MULTISPECIES: Cof-type HAD-IIB family hydrolase [unclassified Spiroplasma]AOX43638.1 HAD superfamily hydrolase [Spiroplasma sp. TU-14]APE13108.1 HAD superfamily hydrolase [Spiroplasma sp. NBRC 100390]